MTEKPSFSSHFWGAGDKGVEALVLRLRQGKHTAESVEQLFKERAAIEEDYAKRLAKLAKSFNGKEELGTLREAIDIVKTELEQVSQTHLKASEEIKLQLSRPLEEMISLQSAERKRLHGLVEKQYKTKAGQMAFCLKTREKLDANCDEIDSLKQQQQQQGAPVKQVEKVRAKLEKAESSNRILEQELGINAERLDEIQKKWEYEMHLCCDNMQQMEEERIEKLRTFLWNFTNIISSSCVSDDESCERIRKSLEKCDINKDLLSAISAFATGTEIIDPRSTLVSAGQRQHSVLERKRSPSTQVTFGKSPPSTSPPIVSLPPVNEDRISGVLDLLGDKKGSNAELAVPPPEQQANTRVESALPVVPVHQDSVAQRNSKVSVNENGSQLFEGSQEFIPYDPYDVPEEITVLFNVRVLYDYASQTFEELSITKDAIVPVITTHEDGWWEGVIVENSIRRKGIFPSNFVEVVTGQ